MGASLSRSELCRAEKLNQNVLRKGRMFPAASPSTADPGLGKERGRRSKGRSSTPPGDRSPLGLPELQGSTKGVVRFLGFPFPCLVQTDAKNQPRRECSFKGFTRCPCQKQSVRIATKFSPYAIGSRDLELNSLSRKPPVFRKCEENIMCRRKIIFSMQHRNHLNPALAAGSELGTESKGFAEGRDVTCIYLKSLYKTI